MPGEDASPRVRVRRRAIRRDDPASSQKRRVSETSARNSVVSRPKVQ